MRESLRAHALKHAIAQCARIRAYDFFCIIDTLTSASVLPGIHVIIEGLPKRVV
jgi:hypothetical protein